MILAPPDEGAAGWKTFSNGGCAFCYDDAARGESGPMPGLLPLRAFFPNSQDVKGNMSHAVE